MNFNMMIMTNVRFFGIIRFDHPDILAGQGTMGLEILEQVPDLDAAVIPVGGGGLIAGVAKAIKTMKPGVKIIVIYDFIRI